MIRTIVGHWLVLSIALSACAGTLLRQHFPFPTDLAILTLIAAQKPWLSLRIRWSYVAMLYTTPFLGCSAAFSLLYIFAVRDKVQKALQRLSQYPNPAERHRLFAVLGEVHLSRTPGPSETPQWLAIPDRGLFTGVAVFGAIGSGKTSCCMYPFAEQILAYRSDDPEHRIGGLVLEVKGDFCHNVKTILSGHGRGEDYVEVSIGGQFCYNPLHNDLEAYALAYGIASLLNNLFGKGKEPFWQQAYTNLVKFIILLTRSTTTT